MPPKGSGPWATAKGRDELAQAWRRQPGVREGLDRDFEAGVGAREGEAPWKHRQRRSREHVAKLSRGERRDLLDPAELPPSSRNQAAKAPQGAREDTPGESAQPTRDPGTGPGPTTGPGRASLPYALAKKRRKRERRSGLWAALTQAAGEDAGDEGQAKILADTLRAHAGPAMLQALRQLLWPGAEAPGVQTAPPMAKRKRRKRGASDAARERVRGRLERFSVEVSAVRRDRKKKVFEARRTLTRSRRRVCLEDPVLQPTFTLRGLARRMKKEQKLYQNPHKKGGICEVCCEYDNTVRPKVKQLVAEVRGMYEAIHAGFFSGFDAGWERRAKDPLNHGSIEHAHALLAYVDKRKAHVPGRRRALPRKQQLDLVDADGSEKRNELSRALAEMRAFGWRFNVAGRQHDAALTQRSQEPGCFYIQFDFVQNLFVPQAGVGLALGGTQTAGSSTPCLGSR